MCIARDTDHNSPTLLCQQEILLPAAFSSNIRQFSKIQAVFSKLCCFIT
jgi:hypothetical protein